MRMLRRSRRRLGPERFCTLGFVRLLLAVALSQDAANLLRAQGSAGVDPSFVASVDQDVTALAVQPDGKVVIGGHFNTVNGIARSDIARLNPDGSVDTSFVSTAVFEVVALVVQADGKIIISGDVLKAGDAVVHQVLGRLNVDGSPDTSYDVEPSGVVDQLIIQPDGMILVSGAFAQINGTNRLYIARLTADGKVDGSFGPVLDTGAQVDAICLQADGKVVVATNTYQNNAPRLHKIVRLNTNGSRDASFSASTDDYVYALAAQPDGRILVAGDFVFANGDLHRALVRLDTSGGIDASFSPPAFYPGTTISGITLQPNGKILARGYYSRLNADGSMDTSFTPGGAAYGTVTSAQPDGSLIVAGYPGVSRILDFSPFFVGETALDDDLYFLGLPNGNAFGYYGVLSDPRYIYHFDLGYEFIYNANDGHAGVYFYDFASGHFFYTSPSFPFPYLYDFSSKAFLYYYPDPNNPGRYNTNGVRYFYNFATGKVITM